MVQGLIRRPHDVAVVTAHQQRLEALDRRDRTGPRPVARKQRPDIAESNGSSAANRPR